MSKYGFVYIWFDRKRKMFYIGSHWGTEKDGYICSSNRMRDAYRRRPDDFKRRVLRTFLDKKELLIEEGKWLRLIENHQLGKKYYNLKNSEFNHWFVDEDSKLLVGQKISDIQKGRISKHRGKTLEEIYGESKALEIKQKMKISREGRVLTEEHRNNISQSLIGKTGYWKDKSKPLSEETKRKIGASNKIALTGRKLTTEHKRKISEGLEARNKGL